MILFMLEKGKLMSKYECLCVSCGTQCEVCLEYYPDNCSCPSEVDN